MSLSFLCLCLPPLILLINENNSELVVDKNISNTIEVGYIKD
jgi:hypothetical protein